MAAKRYILVVNPQGGTRRGLAVLEQVRPIFAAAGGELEVRVTEHSGHARRIAQESDISRYDGFCTIGGDGTVHEVVSGLMQRSEGPTIPLGLIAGGTGNVLAEHLGCTDPVEAARRVLAGRTSPLDVARVTARDNADYCISLIGWGAVADINRTAERLRIIGRLRYSVAALWHILRARRRRAELTLDDRTCEDDFLLVAACNTRCTGSKMLLAPRAALDDGKIDVVVIRHATRRQMFQMFRRVFDGSHVDLPCVEYHQVRRLSIRADGLEPLDLDGENKGGVPVAVEVLPGAMRVFGP
ncbi:MAG: diacylglycerol kinase family lipid kinase [Candidatus Anammoximicrobium sp.]|nr:diacylglycerol kinase family lipid kinase [Candidatus Anammoximicrobium sp.]